MDEIFNEIKDLTKKTRPSKRIPEIREHVKKWMEEPDELIQAKGILAEGIADKETYDTIIPFMSILIAVISSIVTGDVAICLLFLIFIVLVLFWCFNRKNSDYYNELQVIVEELEKELSQKND